MYLLLVVFIILAFFYSNREKIEKLIGKQFRSQQETPSKEGFSELEDINSKQSQSQSQSSYTNNWLNERNNDKLFDESYPDYQLYTEQNTNTDPDNMYKTILSTIQQRSNVSDMFFSDKNVRNLKELLVKDVFDKSNYSISASAQSTTELLIVMRSIFLQYAKHLPDETEKQVAELNYKVLLDVVPRIISKIKMELTYQRDRSSQPIPNALPVDMSITGTKTYNDGPRGPSDFII